MNRIFLIAVPVVLIVAQIATAEVPLFIDYQGVLLDDDGSIVPDGTHKLTIRIYENEVSGNPVFAEEHTVVDVSGGVFSVSIGGGDMTLVGDFRSLSFDRPYWLTLAVDDLGELEPRIPVRSAPYARSAGGSVPIGTVIDWWRPDDTFPVPLDYAICDGHTVDDSTSAYDGLQLPDFTDRFTKGVTDPNAIGETGGRTSHNHIWVERSNRDYYSYNEAGDQYCIYNYNDGVGSEGSGNYLVGATVDGPIYTDYQDTTPPYVGLLKLIRIK